MALSHGPLTSAGVTTSFLPLITPWPVVGECSSLFVSHAQSSDLYAFDPAYPISNSIQCLPPEATSVWAQSGSERTEMGGYSMLCPEAYTTATTSALDSSRTFVGCCPSSYTFVGLASAPNPTQCISRFPAKEFTYLQSDTAGSWTTTSSIQSIAWAVQINGYLFATPTPHLDLRAENTPSSTSPNSPSSTSSSPSPSPTQKSDYIGTATIIGMSIGLGFIAICSIIAAFRFSAKRYRQRPVRPPTQDAIGSLYPELKNDLPTNVTPENFEMSTRRMRRELYPAQFGEFGEGRGVA